MDVTGRVIVVTGGAKGIGRAMAKRFASAGAEAVVVADVDLDSVAAAQRRTPRNHLIEDRRPDSYNAVVVRPPRPSGAVTTLTPP